MRPPTTLSDLQKTACWPLNKAKFETPVKKVKKVSKEKVWMQHTLEVFASEKGVKLEAEYRFDEIRRWRFDWAFPDLKISFEYNGLMSAKSRHTTLTGYTGDMEKTNKAQELGWRVYQYTALNLLDLRIDLLQIMAP